MKRPRNTKADQALLRSQRLLLARIRELEERVRSIEAGNARKIDSALPYLAHLGAKLKSVESAHIELNHSVRALYESRIWKTLRKASEFAIWAGSLGRVRPWENAPSAPAPPAAETTPFRPATPEQQTSGPPDGWMLFVCETPEEGARLPRAGMVKVKGWAIASSGIERVEISVDGASPVPANIGLHRPDIEQGQRALPGAKESGFELWWPCEALEPGIHKIVVFAITKNGNRHSVERSVEVLGDAKEEVFRFHCDHPDPGLLTPVRGVVEVRGWAWAEEGIAQIEVRSEGQSAGLADLGLARPDVAKDNPDLDNAATSGFAFHWDVSELPAGHRKVEVIAESKSGARRAATCEVIVDHKWTHIYEHWIHLHEPDESARKKLAVEVAALPVQPKISILSPIYKTPMPYLKKCVESVRAQRYPNWELCLADDGSGSAEITAYLTKCAQEDPRIKFTTLAANGGISRATNAALEIATGSHIAFLDSDDEIPDIALCEVVRAINLHPDIDVFYSDEDKMDENGQRYDPFFKPNWSPDLFLSCNYLCHFIVCRKDLAIQAGGLDETYRDGTQDYDFLLRVNELTQKFHRIPAILYHWRAIPGSTAQGGEEKPKSTLAGLRAIEEHASRAIAGAKVEIISTGRYRVQYPVDTSQRVAVIMPTGGNLELLGPILEDLFTKTSYPSIELVLVDNSPSAGVERLAREWQGRGSAVRYIDRRGAPFNFSRLNNEAVRGTDAPLVLFLNDDMNVIDPDWLTAMVEHAQRPEIGAVGSLLLYPSGAIQHAGVVMGVYENSAHLFRGLPPKLGVHFDLPVLPRNCSAVTAACLLTRRDVFWEAGAFNETDLAVAFQDVDLCLNIRALGYRIVYTPFAKLYHLESVTKAEKIPNPTEVRYMQKKWSSVIEEDPYYNPNLSRKDEKYSLRFDS